MKLPHIPPRLWHIHVKSVGQTAETSRKRSHICWKRWHINVITRLSWLTISVPVDKTRCKWWYLAYPLTDGIWSGDSSHIEWKFAYLVIACVITRDITAFYSLWWQVSVHLILQLRWRQNCGSALHVIVDHCAGATVCGRGHLASTPMVPGRNRYKAYHTLFLSVKSGARVFVEI